MSSDDDICTMLRVVQDGDEQDRLVDNQLLADALAWSLVDVAACLREAKDRSLVWGVHNGMKPAPWYVELEVTVQGKRFLAGHTSASVGTDSDP